MTTKKRVFHPTLLQRTGIKMVNNRVPKVRAEELFDLISSASAEAGQSQAFTLNKGVKIKNTVDVLIIQDFSANENILNVVSSDYRGKVALVLNQFTRAENMGVYHLDPISSTQVELTSAAEARDLAGGGDGTGNADAESMKQFILNTYEPGSIFKVLSCPDIPALDNSYWIIPYESPAGEVLYPIQIPAALALDPSIHNRYERVGILKVPESAALTDPISLSTIFSEPIPLYLTQTLENFNFQISKIFNAVDSLAEPGSLPGLTEPTVLEFTGDELKLYFEYATFDTEDLLAWVRNKLSYSFVIKLNDATILKLIDEVLDPAIIDDYGYYYGSGGGSTPYILFSVSGELGLRGFVLELTLDNPAWAEVIDLTQILGDPITITSLGSNKYYITDYAEGLDPAFTLLATSTNGSDTAGRQVTYTTAATLIDPSVTIANTTTGLNTVQEDAAPQSFSATPNNFPGTTFTYDWSMVSEPGSGISIDDTSSDLPTISPVDGF